MDESQIISRIRADLSAEDSKHYMTHDAWSRIEQKVAPRPRASRGARIARYAAGFGVVVAVLAIAVGALVIRSNPLSSGNATSATPRGGLAVRTFHLNKGIWGLHVSNGALWVAGYNVTYRVSPATGHIQKTIATPGTSADTSITSGAGSIWVTEGGSRSQKSGVYRINPATSTVTKFVTVPGAVNSAAVVAYGRLWVTTDVDGGTLVRIDPATNLLVGPSIKIGPGAWSMVPAAGGLWVTSYFGNGSVKWISSTGSVAKSPVTSAVNAAERGWLWTVSTVGLQRVSPSTGQTSAIIRIPNLAEVTASDGYVWALTSPPSSSATTYLPRKGSSGMVYRINPSTGKVVGKGVPYGYTPAAVTSSTDGVWISDFTHETLVHVVVHGQRP